MRLWWGPVNVWLAVIWAWVLLDAAASLATEDSLICNGAAETYAICMAYWSRACDLEGWHAPQCPRDLV